MSPLAHRASRVLLCLATAALALLACGKARRQETAPETAALTFVRAGKPTATLSLQQLLARVPAEVVSMVDPYYEKPKRFRALALRRVLDAGFPGGLGGDELIFRALDGYTVPMRAEAARADGAYLAFEDVDVPGWEPIGPRRVSPAPFYLVWSRPEQQDLEGHPRPWQLASVEAATFEAVFPHMSPGALAPDAPAARGYALFQGECIHCHAVNREGGQRRPRPQRPAQHRGVPSRGAESERSSGTRSPSATPRCLRIRT